MTVATSTKLTARQFLQLGEDPPGVRLELMHGEIHVSPSPSFGHSFADRRLTKILLQYIDAHDLGQLVGDVDTIFDEYNVRRPDIIFIAKARLHLRTGRVIPIAPDLCVEILSPSSATLDQVEKLALYAKHGVLHYWIVDPKARTLEGFALENGAYRQVATGRNEEAISLPPFEGLVIPLGELWIPDDG